MSYNDEIFDHVCRETNRYAAQKGNHTLNFDKQELRSFIAVLTLSGHIDLPRHSMYWEMTQDSHNSIVTALFTRKRFNEVLNNLHLADNDNLGNGDKFAKVRPLIQMLNKNCKSNYIPGRHVSIDESMVRYYGRHGLKQ